LRIVVLVEARDRPGVLEEIIGRLRRAGVNIVTNLGYTIDGIARLLFIVESPRPPRELEELLENIEGVEDVAAAELGSDSAELIARFMRDRPGIITVLEFYLEPADLLDALSMLPEEERRKLYSLLSPSVLAGMLVHGDEGVAGEVAESVSVDQLSKAIATLPLEDAAEVLRKLPEKVRGEVLRKLPRGVSGKLREMLGYPAESVGAIMTTSVPVMRDSDTVAEALRRLRGGSYSIRDIVVVVDDNGRLLGVIPVVELLRARADERLGRLVLKPRVTVEPGEDREEAARLMLRYDVSRLPVVSSDGRFLGIVALEDAARVLVEEAGEDIAKLAGMERPREKYRYLSPIELVKLRLPWLILIYFIESITASIIRSYEDVISKVAVVAAFLPLLMDTSGNVGSQASSMIVRALALGEVSEHSRLDTVYIILKELATAALMGLSLAALGLVLVLAIAGGNLRLAIAVSATLFIVVIIADLVGSLLPVLARRLGMDPAALSSPLITTIMDIAAILTYFAMVTHMLGLR
jgi:magnesium transporter